VVPPSGLLGQRVRAPGRRIDGHGQLRRLLDREAGDHGARQGAADLEDVVDFLGRELRHMGAAVGQDAHDRVLLEDAQRLAHGPAADLELLGQASSRMRSPGPYSPRAMAAKMCSAICSGSVIS
jgi:hypothetical protein